MLYDLFFYESNVVDISKPIWWLLIIILQSSLHCTLLSPVIIFLCTSQYNLHQNLNGFSHKIKIYLSVKKVLVTWRKIHMGSHLINKNIKLVY